jgi:hypothetical protein
MRTFFFGAGSGFRPRFEVVLEIVGEQGVQMQGGALALRDTVAAVGVSHHVELLALGDQLVDQQLDALVMDVVVTRTVDQEEVALEASGVVDGGAVVVALGVALEQAAAVVIKMAIVIRVEIRRVVDI